MVHLRGYVPAKQYARVVVAACVLRVYLPPQGKYYFAPSTLEGLQAPEVRPLGYDSWVSYNQRRCYHYIPRRVQPRWLLEGESDEVLGPKDPGLRHLRHYR